MKKGSKKVNRAWLHDHLTDPYVKLAQREGYRARAAYKLKEIDETLGLIKPGHRVVDLGSTPGAWSQYVRRRLSPEGAAVGALNGTIVALDILDFEPIEGVSFIRGDFREESVLSQLEAAVAGRAVDVVVSDMAPNLSGIESSDAARVAHLVELAVEFALRHLKPDGALVCKMFHGSGYSQLVKLLRTAFASSSPSSPRPRETSRPKLFWSASVPKARDLRRITQTVQGETQPGMHLDSTKIAHICRGNGRNGFRRVVLTPEKEPR